MGTAEVYSGGGAREYRASAVDENVVLKFCWWPCGYEEDARRPQCHKKEHLLTGLIKENNKMVARMSAAALSSLFSYVS